MKEPSNNFNIAKRKDKLLTLTFKNKNNNLLRESVKRLSVFNSVNFSEIRNLKSVLRRMKSREITSKNSMEFNLDYKKISPNTKKK